MLAEGNGQLLSNTLVKHVLHYVFHCPSRPVLQLCSLPWEADLHVLWQLFFPLASIWVQPTGNCQYIGGLRIAILGYLFSLTLYFRVLWISYTSWWKATQLPSVVLSIQLSLQVPLSTFYSCILRSRGSNNTHMATGNREVLILYHFFPYSLLLFL